jgi:hypothetical protein
MQTSNSSYVSFGGSSDGSDLYADEEDIREYAGQSSIGCNHEYWLREVIEILMLF